jgi:hypothetical protein
VLSELCPGIPGINLILRNYWLFGTAQQVEDTSLIERREHLLCDAPAHLSE